MDKGSGSGEHGGVSTEDGGVSLTLLTVGLLGGHSGEVGGLGGGNLRSVLHGLRGNSGVHGGDKGLGVEGRGDKGLGVESRGDTVVDGSHRQPGVGHTEAGGVSDVLDGLQFVVGINVGVSAGHTTVGVSDLVLHAVQVGVAVVQVSELVLGMELGAGVGGDGGGVGSS